MEFNPLPTSTGVIYKQWEKQPGETERLMGEVKVRRMYSKVACDQRFTWLWSSSQFCTRNREGVQKGQRGIRSLAKLERRGRMDTRKQLTGQRKHLSKRAIASGHENKYDPNASHLKERQAKAAKTKVYHMTNKSSICQHHKFEQMSAHQHCSEARYHLISSP